MLEFEKKLLLTAEEYNEIINKIGDQGAEPVLQTNYYFDTENLEMNSKGITCRIRFKDGKYTAEIKCHGEAPLYGSIESRLFTSDEFNETYFSSRGLYLQGSLITQRRTVYRDEFCEIVLDKNAYLGVTDYELEIEYKEQYEKYAERMLCSVAEYLLSGGIIKSLLEFLDRVDNSESKSRRFFKEKMKK